MDRLNDILYKAQQHKKRNWLLSKVILENALQDFPNEKLLYVELGDLYSYRKMYKKAIQYYTNALKFTENDNDLLFKIATNFLHIDQFALSIEYYDQIKEKDAETLYNIAYAYSRLHKHEKSIEILYDLIENYNTTEIPFLLLAEIYYSRRDYKKSLQTLDDAEKKFGESAAIFYLKASVYAQMEYWIHAVNFYKKADRLNARFPNFYRNYAIAVYKLGYSEKAVSFLKRNLKFHNKDSSTFFYLIKILLELSRFEEADEYIKKVKEKNTMDLNHLAALEMELMSKYKKKR